MAKYLLEPVMRMASIVSGSGYRSGSSSTCHLDISRPVSGSKSGRPNAFAPDRSKNSKTPPYPWNLSFVLGKGVSHSRMAIRRGWCNFKFIVPYVNDDQDIPKTTQEIISDATSRQRRLLGGDVRVDFPYLIVWSLHALSRRRLPSSINFPIGCEQCSDMSAANSQQADLMSKGRY